MTDERPSADAGSTTATAEASSSNETSPSTGVSQPTETRPSTEASSSTETSQSAGASPATTGRLASVYAIQRDVRDRWALAAVAATVGLVLSTVHWSGLLVGGALVGLCWPTFRRALAAGLGFGVVVLLVVAMRFVAAGSLEAVLGMGPILGIGVAIPLVAGPLGAAVRGLFPDAPADDTN